MTHFTEIDPPNASAVDTDEGSSQRDDASLGLSYLTAKPLPWYIPSLLVRVYVLAVVATIVITAYASGPENTSQMVRMAMMVGYLTPSFIISLSILWLTTSIKIFRNILIIGSIITISVFFARPYIMLKIWESNHEYAAYENNTEIKPEDKAYDRLHKFVDYKNFQLESNPSCASPYVYYDKWDNYCIHEIEGKLLVYPPVRGRPSGSFWTSD